MSFESVPVKPGQWRYAGVILTAATYLEKVFGRNSVSIWSLLFITVSFKACRSVWLIEQLFVALSHKQHD